MAVGAAALIFKFEARPAYRAYKRKANAFLEASWILDKDQLFVDLNERFTDNGSTGLGIKPFFRSLKEHDVVTQGTTRLINTMKELREYWNDIGDFFGELPAFKDNQESTTLHTDEIRIRNVSNPNVKYLGHEGQMVKFQSLSGEVEEFEYEIVVDKEGFSYTAKAQGTVVAFDSLAYYKSIMKGNWAMHYEDGQITYYRFDNEDFTGQITGQLGSDGVYQDLNVPVRKWEVKKAINGRYMIEIWATRRVLAYITNPGELEFITAYNH